MAQQYDINSTLKLDWAMPFSRTGAFPLDRTAIFTSYEDAVEYAAGTGDDERHLGGTAYVGQVLTVITPAVDDVPADVKVYVIAPNSTLKPVGVEISPEDIEEIVKSLLANYVLKSQVQGLLDFIVDEFTVTPETGDPYIDHTALDACLTNLKELIGALNDGQGEAVILGAQPNTTNPEPEPGE